MAMAGELCGWDRPLVMHHYDDTFKEFRRYFFKLFGTRQSLEAFYPLFESEGHVLMRRILAAPGDFPTHLRKFVLPPSYSYTMFANSHIGVRALSFSRLHTATTSTLLAVIPSWTSSMRVYVRWTTS